VQKSTQKPHKILILEDNEADAELLDRRLRETSLNLELRRVISKVAYLDALENFAPDIIISDYKLPDLDGYSAFNLARERNPYIPFIIMSGYVDDSFASRMLKAGVTDFILKDRPERLGSAIERALLQVGERQLEREYKNRTQQLEIENEELRKRELRIRQLRDELEKLRNEIKRT
jgi:DNA-binding NtrC family response regulator